MWPPKFCSPPPTWPPRTLHQALELLMRPQHASLRDDALPFHMLVLRRSTLSCLVILPIVPQIYSPIKTHTGVVSSMQTPQYPQSKQIIPLQTLPSQGDFCHSYHTFPPTI